MDKTPTNPFAGLNITAKSEPEPEPALLPRLVTAIVFVCAGAAVVMLTVKLGMVLFG
jgi:hypothetical protein